MDDNDIEKMAAIMHEAIEHYGVSLQTVVAACVIAGRRG